MGFNSCCFALISQKSEIFVSFSQEKPIEKSEFEG